MEDLHKIIDYIALDKPSAAKKFASQIFQSVDRLARFPRSGKKIEELQNTIYLELMVYPVRIFYRMDGDDAVVLHLCRGEHLLDPELLANP